MKKHILIIILLASTTHLFAQNIQNPSFDSLYIGGIDRIYEWTTSDGFIMNAGTINDTVQALTPNTHYNASGFLFSEMYNNIQMAASPYSTTGLVLSTAPNYKKQNNDFFETYIVNGNQFKTDADGYLDLKSSGEPFAFKPTKLKGKYKFIDSSSTFPNFGKCIILLKKFNSTTNSIDTMAFIENSVQFPRVDTWQDFEIPISYQQTGLPDSIVVAFYAATEPSQQAYFYIDEISFEFGTNSLELFEQKPNTIVYPNPSNGTFLIKPFDKIYENYRLLNLNGQIILAGVFVNELALSSFSDQFFILQLIDKNGEIDYFRLAKIK